MIGSTGVGKTEIARRLARLANSPFIKIEASKFTEVGYVGRDVESMIRELADVAVDMTKQAAFRGRAAAGRRKCRGKAARYPAAAIDATVSDAVRCRETTSSRQTVSRDPRKASRTAATTAISTIV